ncbi:Fibroblast growth factor receptor-like 1 [Takifugu flavidus]|uniref:Fibroblast growth factor receptor-like 1 n=1 Tax=Takifugu flavidus TaxID=433684 RepID=A0A5C6MV68_9TELE|nr:Fibroblast growth factor receptor-like 1 [Takifugu flavidus]
MVPEVEEDPVRFSPAGGVVEPCLSRRWCRGLVHLQTIEGSTVEISCNYSYPHLQRGLSVVDRLWFISEEDNVPVDLRTLSQFAGRVEYFCHSNKCSLIIRKLRESDSNVYKFRFITNMETGKYTGEPGVSLRVTGLKVKEYNTKKYICESQCNLAGPISYIWYKNEEKVERSPTKYYSGNVRYSDFISCAVKGHEDFPSPLKCVNDWYCATYTKRSICTFKGSSVDISCHYDERTSSSFWYRFEVPQHHRDLTADPQYGRRVEVFSPIGSSTLRIKDLKKNDSANYRFKITSYNWKNLPGTTLTVTDPDLNVQVFLSPFGLKLICHSSCLQDRFPLIWYENDRIIPEEKSASYRGHVWPMNSYSCGYQTHRSQPVYAPTVPLVTMSPPGGAVQNSSVNLTCHSDANPEAKYAWFRANQMLVSEESQLFIKSLQASDCGEYYCTAENQFGSKTSGYVSVELLYAPKSCSVSVSPSAVVAENTTVTLSCSSDANPAANYSWYKENQTLTHQQEGVYRFTSIRSEDGGIYHCRSENQYGEINSTALFLDIQYAPRHPSVSVSSPGEVEEDTTVTLRCSSDANPAANYSWYKEGENSPKSSEQNFTITHVRAEDSGHYSCRVWNTRGHLTSSLHLVVASDVTKLIVVGIVSVAMVFSLFLTLLWIRMKKMCVKKPTKCRKPLQTRVQIKSRPTAATLELDQDQDQDQALHYASIHLHLDQNDVLYSNIRPVHGYRQTDEDEDSTEYTCVMDQS